jgi:hypothetical protein
MYRDDLQAAMERAEKAEAVVERMRHKQSKPRSKASVDWEAIHTLVCLLVFAAVVFVCACWLRSSHEEAVAAQAKQSALCERECKRRLPDIVGVDGSWAVYDTVLHCICYGPEGVAAYNVPWPKEKAEDDD